MHPFGDSGTSTVPAFLTKLWTLVEDPSTDELICWDVSGKSFHVFDQGRFSKEVLPLYFKHSNIASFVRQLNMYGFRKVVNVESGGLKVEKDDMEFAHQYFQRDKEELLEHIKRKVPNFKSDEMKVKQYDVHRVLTDVRALKGKQECMSNKLESVKRENELLWLEVASLRQKHMKQQQIVNKLIQFLVSLVGNRGVERKRKMPLMLNDASQIEASKKAKFNQRPFLQSSPASKYQVSSPEPQVQVEEGVITPTISIHEVTDPSFLVDSSEQIVNPSWESGTVEENEDPHEILQEFVRRAVDKKADESDGVLSAESLTDVNPDAQEIIEPSTTANEASTSPVDSPSKAEAAEAAPKISTETWPGLSTVPIVSDVLMGSTPKTDVQVSEPSTSVVRANPKVLHREMSDHLDTLQADLDSLKDLLSSGQYTFEPSTIMGMFEIASPLSDQQPSTSSSLDAITGNELVQYNPPEDISTLFDLGDLSASPSLELDGDSLSTLNTPLVTDTSHMTGPNLMPPEEPASEVTEEVD